MFYKKKNGNTASFLVISPFSPDLTVARIELGGDVEAGVVERP